MITLYGANIVNIYVFMPFVAKKYRSLDRNTPISENFAYFSCYNFRFEEQLSPRKETCSTSITFVKHVDRFSFQIR